MALDGQAADLAVPATSALSWAPQVVEGFSLWLRVPAWAQQAAKEATDIKKIFFQLSFTESKSLPSGPPAAGSLKARVHPESPELYFGVALKHMHIHSCSTELGWP